MATGPGLLEGVYGALLSHELRSAGLHVEQQVSVRVKYIGLCFAEGFRADIFVGNKVLLKLKSIEKVSRVH